MTPHPTIHDIAANLLRQFKQMGLNADDLLRMAKERRLVWQAEVYGRSWVLNGKVILMWNDVTGEFMPPIDKQLGRG